VHVGGLNAPVDVATFAVDTTFLRVRVRKGNILVVPDSVASSRRSERLDDVKDWTAAAIIYRPSGAASRDGRRLGFAGLGAVAAAGASGASTPIYASVVWVTSSRAAG
jgi:hypothetical protein